MTDPGNRRGSRRPGSESLDRGARRRDLLALACLTGVFLVSRLLAARSGLAFDATPLGTFWQYLDPVLLREDLWRSLLYLHSQPPLFNAIVGMLLKISPELTLDLLRWGLLGVGIGLALGSYVLFRRLEIRPLVAFVASSILTLRPEALLYETWLVYDLPIAAALVAAALTLVAADRGSSTARHGFFWILALLALGRSFFHLVYLLAVLGVIAWPRQDRRRWLAAAALPLLLVVGLYAKNSILFGQFGASSWMGLNMARVATAALSDAERLELVADGSLSPALSVRPFSPAERYPEIYHRNLRYPTVPAVAALRKQNGAANYNHEAFLTIGRAARADALWILRRRPDLYAAGVARGVYYFTTPGSEELHLRRRAVARTALARRFEALVYLRVPAVASYRGRELDLFLTPLIGIPWALLASLLLWKRSIPTTTPRALIVFLALTTLYVSGVGTGLEVWENARFRYLIDAFWVGLALAGCTQRTRPHRDGPPPGPIPDV